MTSAPAVVVAHGLWMPGTETWLLRKRLADHGFRPYLFRYRTVGRGLDANARALAELCARVPEETVHLVGYSLGGVICVHLLKTVALERIGRLVCIGSPLNGSGTASTIMRLPGGRRLLGRSIIDLAEHGGVGPWDRPVELGSLAGRINIGLGRLFRGLEGDNDGTVAVAETRIEGAHDYVVRNVSHTTMLFSRVVADDIARFLKHGAFETADAT